MPNNSNDTPVRPENHRSRSRLQISGSSGNATLSEEIGDAIDQYIVDLYQRQEEARVSALDYLTYLEKHVNDQIKILGGRLSRHEARAQNILNLSSDSSGPSSGRGQNTGHSHARRLQNLRESAEGGSASPAERSVSGTTSRRRTAEEAFGNDHELRSPSRLRRILSIPWRATDTVGDTPVPPLDIVPTLKGRIPLSEAPNRQPPADSRASQAHESDTESSPDEENKENVRPSRRSADGRTDRTRRNDGLVR